LRTLAIADVKHLLASVHLNIGAWNQVSDPSGRPYAASEWINHAAPVEALSLYCFSHQILRWLEPGDWILVHTDNSTNFTYDEIFLISRLLSEPTGGNSFAALRSVLFELSGSGASRERLLSGDLLYTMLLFRAHCQVVSAGSVRGQHLSLQDGFVYFISKDARDISNALDLLKQLEQTPLLRP